MDTDLMERAEAHLAHPRPRRLKRLVLPFLAALVITSGMIVVSTPEPTAAASVDWGYTTTVYFNRRETRLIAEGSFYAALGLARFGGWPGWVLASGAAIINRWADHAVDNRRCVYVKIRPQLRRPYFHISAVGTHGGGACR